MGKHGSVVIVGSGGATWLWSRRSGRYRFEDCPTFSSWVVARAGRTTAPIRRGKNFPPGAVPAWCC